MISSTAKYGKWIVDVIDKHERLVHFAIGFLGWYFLDTVYYGAYFGWLRPAYFAKYGGYSDVLLCVLPVPFLLTGWALIWSLINPYRAQISAGIMSAVILNVLIHIVGGIVTYRDQYSTTLLFSLSMFPPWIYLIY